MINKEQKIIGIIEEIIIFSKNENLKVKAKIDTGATRSSIDLNIVEKLKLGPIIRTKLIRSVEGTSKRPVIEVKIKFAKKIITEEFTVANRSKMKFPVLIGLNILKKGFIIDPNKK
jgi:hypothetical protein